MARKLTPLLLVAAAIAVPVLGSSSAAAADLLAPASNCPLVKLDAPVALQEQAMLCLTNYARAQTGEAPLEATAALEESAREKARDIFKCDSFSHYACGREFAYWIRQTGYLSTECWRAGENLAWGVGNYGTVRSIFRAWLRSTEHRENILGNYTQVGIDLKTGSLNGRSGTRVWTQHFGSHCEAPPAA